MRDFNHRAVQIYQNQGFISSPFFGKNTITFCNMWAIFARKQGGVTSQKVRIKIWEILFYPHDFWWISFSSFEAKDHKGHFRKILIQIFKFGCFSSYHVYTFQENESDFLMQNLMLNGLAPISNPKNKKTKSSYALF